MPQELEGNVYAAEDITVRQRSKEMNRIMIAQDSMVRIRIMFYAMQTEMKSRSCGVHVKWT